MSFLLSQKILFASTAGCGLVALGFFLGRQSANNHSQSLTNLAETSSTTSHVFSGATTSASSSQVASNSPTPLSESAKAREVLPKVPLTPLAEEAMCAELKALGATDTTRALQFVQNASTPRQRENFRNAVLQGWASRDPKAAATWALANVRPEERRVAVEAIAAGAINRPDDAVQAFNHLMAADPQLTSDYGNSLAFAFARAGQFETASQFAAAGPLEYRAAWLSSVFNQWATYQPQASLAALNQIKDPAAQHEAMQGIIAGWSSSDPAGLVAYAETLPSGEMRLNALRDGLSQWVYRDPKTATEWMDKHDPNPDLDAGAAAVAVLPALIEKKPDIAASWAESIVDPELRINTLLDLIRIWGTRDIAAARNYAATTPALPADRRELALSSLQPSP